MQALIILFYINCVISVMTTALYRGGCDVLNNKIYYFGGTTFGENQTDFKTNGKVFYLDLSSGFNLDQNTAPWEKIADNGPKLVYQNVVRNPKDSSFILFGGFGLEKEKSFNEYYIKDNTYKVNEKASKSFPFLTKTSGNVSLPFANQKSSFTIDDKDSNLYYHFGGYTETKDSKNSAKWNKLTVYNSLENSFTVLGETQTPVYHHMANKYKNKLYVIGGAYLQDVELREMDSIIIYDFDKKEFTREKAKGPKPEPRIGGASILINNKIYIVGGGIDLENKLNPKPIIYTLNLDNLEYEQHEIADFKPTSMACLTYYNNHLIHSFGTYNSEIQNTTQIININDWKLVQRLPKIGEANTYNNNTKTGDDKIKSELNLPLIIGCSVGGLVVLIAIILILIVYFVKRNNKAKENIVKVNAKLDEDEYQPPEMLKEHIWIDPKLDELNDVDMNLNNGTVIPGFDYANVITDSIKFDSRTK